MDPRPKCASGWKTCLVCETVVKDIRLFLFSMYYFKWYASQWSLMK